jgi:hypothetical protein
MKGSQDFLGRQSYRLLQQRSVKYSDIGQLPRHPECQWHFKMLFAAAISLVSCYLSMDSMVCNAGLNVNKGKDQLEVGRDSLGSDFDFWENVQRHSSRTLEILLSDKKLGHGRNGPDSVSVRH